MSDFNSPSPATGTEPSQTMQFTEQIPANMQIAAPSTPALITLTQWRERNFAPGAIHANTVRTWAAKKLIFPAPVRHGRDYYVEPTARYVPKTQGADA